MSRRFAIVVCLISLAGEVQLSACQLSDQQEAVAPSDNELLRGLVVTPKVVRAAAALIEPSLVTIESFGGVSTKQGRIGGIRSQGEGNTTGVVISSDGYVITSLFNFIQQPKKITVKTSDGVRHVADVMGRDVTRNICILKIEEVDNLTVPEFLDPDQVQVGQWAISVGVGFGDENTAISTGIISARNRIGGRAIQTDANISPANYGGPLLDIEGRVIGICVPLSPGSSSAGAGVEWYDSGIGFAIPIRGNEGLIERMKKGESIDPGYIGIRPTFASGVTGAVVSDVIADSPAEKVKIKKGDLIVKIDEHQVLDQVSMRQILNRYFAGDKITLTIMRKVTDLSTDEADEQESDKTGQKGNDRSKDQVGKDAERDNEDKNSHEEQDIEGQNKQESDDDTSGDEQESVGEESVDDVERVEITIEVELARRPENNPEEPMTPEKMKRPGEK